MIKKFLLLVFIISNFNLFTEENSENLFMNIAARIIDNEDVVVWSSEKESAVNSGKAMKIKISGKNLLIIASFTPYEEKDDKILVISQSHIWYSKNKKVKYYSAVKSMYVKPGEKLIFLPFGMNKKNFVKNTVELEINIQE